MMLSGATTRAKPLVIAAVISGCGAFMAAVLLTIALARPSLNSDFMAFWSFPRFAAAHPVGDIYNAARLQAFQQSLYPGFHSFYPYLYPPTLLLLTWWLRFCSFATAQLLWTSPAWSFSCPPVWPCFAAGWCCWRCWPARPRCSTW